jgi:hypothetical protein
MLQVRIRRNKERKREKREKRREKGGVAQGVERLFASMKP